MSKKSCPFLSGNSRYRNEQDFLDIQYFSNTLMNLTYKALAVVVVVVKKGLRK